MNVEILKWIAQGGAAVATLVVVFWFLRFLREERTDRAEERKRSTDNFTNTINNHVAHHTEALEKQTDAINSLSQMCKSHLEAGRRGA